FTEESTYTYAGNLVGLVSMVIILWTINIETALIFLAGLTGMFLVGRITIKKSALYEKKLTDVQSTKKGKIFDSISNFPSIKSFHKELTELGAIQDEQKLTIAAAKHSYKWSVVFWASMSVFVRYLIWVTVILLNVHLFLIGEVSLAQLTTLLS